MYCIGERLPKRNDRISQCLSVYFYVWLECGCTISLDRFIVGIPRISVRFQVPKTLVAWGICVSEHFLSPAYKSFCRLGIRRVVCKTYVKKTTHQNTKWNSTIWQWNVVHFVPNISSWSESFSIIATTKINFEAKYMTSTFSGKKAVKKASTSLSQITRISSILISQYQIVVKSGNFSIATKITGVALSLNIGSHYLNYVCPGTHRIKVLNQRNLKHTDHSFIRAPSQFGVILSGYLWIKAAAMALEYANLPLAGDIIDDFALLFRELMAKVNIQISNNFIQFKKFKTTFDPCFALQYI